MRLKGLVTYVLAGLLVFGMVPDAALAEASEWAQMPVPVIEARINAADDEVPWVSYGSVEEAEARDGEASGPEEITLLELRTAQAGDAALAVSTRAMAEPDIEEEWVDRDFAIETQVEGPLSGIAIVPRDGDGAHLDVLYRVHNADRGWSAWETNGVPAEFAADAALDGVQVVAIANAVGRQMAEGDAPRTGNLAAEDADRRLGLGTEAQDGERPEGGQTAQQPDKAVVPVAADASQHAADEPQAADVPQADDASQTGDAPQTAEVRTTRGLKPAAGEEPTLAQELPEPPDVTYRAYIRKSGWQKNVRNGALAGTTKKNREIAGIRISLPAGTDGGIKYRSYVKDKGWRPWVEDGATSGIARQARRIEGFKVKLYGEVAKTFDVWYRAYVPSGGWQNWVKNGTLAGTAGKSRRMQAFQVALMPKGAGAPLAVSAATVEGADHSTRASISYRVSTAGTGWQGWMSDGETAGAKGISALADSFAAQLVGLSSSELSYCVGTKKGWQDEVTAGQAAGKPGSKLALEAIKMRLSGRAAQLYDVYYRVYAGGWTGWAKNGAPAGSMGLSRAVEAVEARLVVRDGKAPGSERDSFAERPILLYRSRLRKEGWKGWVAEGGVSGSTKKGLRVESLQTKISSSQYSGMLCVNAYVQGRKWVGYTAGNGEVAGARNGGLRVEALKMKLTGQLAEHYDVYYRVHVKQFGWLGWTKNDGAAGSSELSLQIQAVQIRLQDKGGSAPGKTKRPFIEASSVSKLGYQNPKGFYQVSRKNVEITPKARAPWNYVTPSRIKLWSTRKDCVKVFVKRAREYLGTPYKWDYSCAPGVGVDCIGLVYQCAYACGMDMGGGTGHNDFNPWAHWITGANGWHSHDANNFWNYRKAMHVRVSSRRVGDVLYYPGHVAIYVGNNKVIEAYPKTGVAYASMSAHGYPTGCIRLFQ